MLNEMKGVMEKLSSGMEKMEPWDVVLLNLWSLSHIPISYKIPFVLSFPYRSLTSGHTLMKSISFSRIISWKKFFFLYFFVFLFCGHQLKNYITMNSFYAGSISLLMSYEILLLSIFFFLFLRLNSFVWILLHIVHNPSQVFGNFRINAWRFLSIATRFCSKWHDTVLNHVYNIIYFCSALKWTATVAWIKNIN